MKNIRIFNLKIFLFLAVKLSIYLNRRVFVMEKKYFNKMSPFIKMSIKMQQING